MDIGTQSEVVLRGAGYETWPWTGTSPPVICFESATVVGFVHVFGSAKELLDTWQAAQQRILARHAAALRAGGAKAWNVYSVFLTSELAPTLQHQVEKLEENFALTRKIARTAIQTAEDVTNVLMPLTPIKAKPLLESDDIADRLRSRAKDVPVEALNAFLGDLRPEDVAEILGSPT
ncbi:hypothetical protein XH98_28485 [Bradyrhizobium sp. CCBAU 51745]|uniref:hypothetical protein n=1 Tax=Bradyrhizobium sp. CCBAU 51745 TaxID=1325099 RepID=UPI0023053C80|nr:hypothetical protein [Bradyrhizobium sp. CCBAU 51745]MDA9442963.1 hypothetical protein [Bradyrhizobium sp. CCBAU 51745]